MAKDLLTILKEVRGTGAPEAAYTDGIYFDIAEKTVDSDGITPRLGAGMYGSMQTIYNSLGSIIGMSTELAVLEGMANELHSLYIDKVTLDSIYADKVKLDSIYSDKATLDSIYADKLKLDSLYADKLTLDSIFLDKSKLDSLFTDKLTLDSLYADKAKLDSIYADKVELDSIYTNLAAILRVHTSIDNVDSVVTNIANIDIAAANMDAINATGTNISAVNDVSTNMAAVTTVANVQNLADIVTVANDLNSLDLNGIADVTIVANDLVLGVDSAINTVSAGIADVTAVNTNIGVVNTVATNIVDVQSVANTIVPNIAEILLADTNAIATAADVLLTNADAASTAADVITTNNIVSAILNGRTWFFGAINPTTEGVDGDMAYNTVSTETFQKVTGSWVSQGILKGDNGNGISSIIRTSGTGAPGTTDTYTITFTDLTTTTFTVYNGANGTGTLVSVVGGTNISIDNTDANNPVINATGLQPVSNDLTSIDALAGTSGILTKTALDTWALDTNTYLTAETSHADVLVDGDFITAGLMKTDGAGTYSIDATVYEPADATILKDADIGVTVQAYDATIVVDADIGVSVQAYDIDTAKLDVAQTFTATQAGAITTDNDVNFDLGVTNYFKSTPTAGFTLTFTNFTAGRSGIIILDNSGAWTPAKSANVKADADFLTTIAVAGVYQLGYIADGTNVYVTYSKALV